MDNNKVDVLEISAITLSLLFILVISQYHISYEGFRGLTENQWNRVWVIAENSLNLTMSTLITILAGSGLIRLMFKYIFIPYFIVKLIYQCSMFFQIYIVSKEWWESIWSFICVSLLTIGVFYCLRLIRKYRKNVAKIFKFKVV
jgi:hypothetical protein